MYTYKKEDKGLFSPIYDIDDPQAEWQSRNTQPGVLSTQVNGDLVLSSSQLEESLLSDVVTVTSGPIDSNSETFQVNGSVRSNSPYNSGPNTSTTKREYSSSENRQRFKSERGRVSVSPKNTPDQISNVQNISEFDRISGQGKTEATRPRPGKKAPVPIPRDKKPSTQSERTTNFQEEKRGKEAVTRLMPATTGPSRVLVLDENRLLCPVQEDQVASLMKKESPFTHTRSMNNVMTHLTSIPVDRLHHFAVLGQHMTLAFMKEQFLDVIIYVGNQVFKSHRVVLSCFSKYFADAFASANKPKIPMELKLAGISPKAFHLFLEYMYSGIIELKPDNIGEVAIAAEFLDITVLKEKTAEFMDRITVGQALLVIETGNIPVSSEIYRMSYESVMEHYCECYDTIPFNSLRLEYATNILRDDRLQIFTEMDVFWGAIKWISFDLKDREKHLNHVMECVRFPYLTQAELFKCLETSDLLKTSEKCKQSLISANWIVSSEERKKRDLLDLPKPLPRLCHRKQPVSGSTDTFMSITDDYTISLPELNLRDAFSCDIIGNEADKPSAKPIEEILAPKHLNEKKAPSAAPRPVTPSPIFITGEILVIGGFQQDNKDSHTHKHMERYCCEDQQWKHYADMPEPRHHHAVAYLSNKLYLTGGTNPKKTLTRRVTTACSSVFQFDPEVKIWKSCSPMNSSRMYHKLCALYGMLYAVGGQDERFQVLTSVECYNPKINGWVYVHPMNTARMGMGAAVSDGKLFVAGGHGDGVTRKTELPILHSLEAFDPRNNQWTSLCDLRIPRCFASLTAIGSKLYLCGGASRSFPVAKDGGFNSVSLIEVYNIKDDKWEYKTEMIIPRHHHGAAVIGTKLFMIGGMSTTNNKTMKSVECFDTKTDSWDNAVNDLQMPAKWICCTVLPVQKPE